MRLILTLSFAGIMLMATAQITEIADQSTDEQSYYRVIELSDGRLAYASERAQISVRHPDGSVAWEIVDDYMTASDRGDMIAMWDGGLVQVGIANGCDVFGPGRIRRVDPAGDVVWEKDLDVYGLEYGDDFYMLAKSLSSWAWGTLAVASPWGIRFLDEWDGQQIGHFSWTPYTNYIKKLHWASDTTLFIVDGTYLKVADLNGVVLHDTPIGEGVLDLQVFDARLFVLTMDSVHRFGPDLEVNGATPITGAVAYSSFVRSGDNLYVQTSTGLYLLEEDGTATLLFPWPTLPAYTHTGCVIHGDTVHEVGYTNLNWHYTNVLRKLSLSGEAPVHNQDVEALIQVDSAYTVAHGPYWDRKAVVTAHVVNHGPDTLRSVLVTLRGVVWFSMYCEVLQHRLNPTDLAVAPGDTIALSFGEVYVAKDLWNSDVQNPAWQVCITALAPDKLVDRDPNDNRACATKDFIFLGVEEPDPSAALLLAPNPADGLVTVTGNAMLGVPLHLRILDGTGRLVMEQSVLVPDGRTELDVSSLPPGTYILDAVGSQARSTAKLMVVRP